MRLMTVLLVAVGVLMAQGTQAGEVRCKCPYSEENSTGNGSCAVAAVEDACSIATQSFDQMSWNAGLARLKSITGETLDAAFLTEGISQSRAQQMASDNPNRLVDSLFAMSFVSLSTVQGDVDKEGFMTLFDYLRRNAESVASAFAGTGEVREYNNAVGYGVRQGCFQVRSQLTFGGFSFMFRTDWADFDKDWTCVTTD